jgi:uncharacterized membrane protein YbhN (UPF0104 family)
VHKRILGNVLKYLLAVVLLACVVYKNWAPEGGKGLEYVLDRHFVQGQPIHWWFLAGGFFIYAFALMITLIRWYFLVRAQDLPFTVPEALRIGLVGFFFNSFLPGSVGGDIVKAAALARQQDRRTVAVATVVMDRVIALWGLVWFVAILGAGFWLSGLLEGEAGERSKLVVGIAGGTVAASLVVWVVMGLLPDRRAARFASRLSCIPKVGGSAAEMWRAVWMYRKRQGTVFGVLALSWVGHVGFVLAFYCCARVLWGPEDGPIPTLTQHFLLVPIGLVVQAVIPTPGGAGAGEWGFGALYKYFTGSAAAESNGVLASLVQRIVTWTIGLLGYLVYLRMRSRIQVSEDTIPVIPAEPAFANGIYAKEGEGVAR